MLKINKLQEPEFLMEFKKKNDPKSWEDYNSKPVKKELRAFMLEGEQNKYCPYCEKAISNIEDCHIEHIKPRDSFPQLFQEYKNLLVSCNDKNTCGNSKGNSYKNDFINPVLDKPKDFFTFNLATGEIIPIVKSEDAIEYKRAVYTIELLNLNSFFLKEARRNLILSLEVYKNNYEDYLEYLQFFLGDGSSFPSLIEHYMIL